MRSPYWRRCPHGSAPNARNATTCSTISPTWWSNRSTGSGGIGVVIGPEATPEALDDRRRELQSQPERFIAQEAIALSTHPTFDGEGMYPHHVDLRAFVHLRPDGMNGVTAEVMPAGLTRVAAHGSRIVNSSSGGGSKDTWILTGGPHRPGNVVGERTTTCVESAGRSASTVGLPTSPRWPG